MKNIVATIEGNMLVLKIDLTKKFGPSKSGTSDIVASTGGNISVPGREEIKMGINVYTPRNQ
ncbi:MAG TPA: hypothetical protein VFA10_20135 [Ktedonobacteraceae bacterium]|nr:hypothetical protein [Ktedonobacteraceae bacterium]